MHRKLTGFKDYRLDQKNNFNVCLSIPELRLVNGINNEPDPEGFLDSIIGHPRGYLTQDEQKVAMTIIQWFGTNVGRSFHAECMKKADKQMVVANEMQEKIKKEIYTKFFNDSGKKHKELRDKIRETLNEI